MAKSDKATVLRRVQEVLKLLLAGAEFADIRQYASDQGWEVSDRQVRRYMEAAYKRMVKASSRDRKQLLGRHLMQRRALYARCMKASDLRTALAVLKDEAALHALYPPLKVAPTTPDGKYPYVPGPPEIAIKDRLARLVMADMTKDKVEIHLLDESTPKYAHFLPDTFFPEVLLHILTLIYVTEQLEHAGQLLQAFWCTQLEGDESGAWDFAAHVAAYRYQIGGEAWRQFTEWLGVDGQRLVQANYSGALLSVCDTNICNLAPTAEELRTLVVSRGHEVDEVVTAEDLCASWKRMIKKLLD